jgi:hypothetical protein
MESGTLFLSLRLEASPHNAVYRMAHCGCGLRFCLSSSARTLSNHAHLLPKGSGMNAARPCRIFGCRALVAARKAKQANRLVHTPCPDNCHPILLALQRMEAAGCMPSIATWNTLLGLLVNPSEGGIDVGVEILTIMRRADVPINQATFAALANVRKAIEKEVRALVSFPVAFIYARSSSCSDTNSEVNFEKAGRRLHALARGCVSRFDGLLAAFLVFTARVSPRTARAQETARKQRKSTNFSL